MAKDTKDKILKAALKLFSERGLSNVSVVDIAEMAGVSRTAVNHHFITKDLLYEKAFKFAITQMLPSYKVLTKDEYYLETCIRLFVDKYIKMLEKYPNLPSFLIYAVNDDKPNLTILDQNIHLDAFYSKISSKVKLQEMIKINPQYVLILILSLCNYPMIGQKLTSLSVGMYPDVYDSFLKEQRNIVTDFVLRGLGLNPLN